MPTKILTLEQLTETVKFEEPDEWPTFKQLVALEPRLGDLFEYARAMRGPKKISYLAALQLWHRGGIKNDMGRLVGCYRNQEHPILSTQTAYNIAYRTIFQVLSCQKKR